MDDDNEYYILKLWPLFKTRAQTARLGSTLRNEILQILNIILPFKNRGVSGFLKVLEGGTVF